jgi:RHS repeat-associated protein
MEAALDTVPVLAADFRQQLIENSHRGPQTYDSDMRRVIELANSQNASGLAASLYDDGRRSRSTGKERDSESGLDYFGARYYGSALGRSTSPHWSAKPQPVPYVDLSNPQSLNLYVYVQNNLLTKRDLDGHVCIFGLGNTCAQPPRPTVKLPAPPGAPAIVEMNGHKVSDPKVTKALAAISVYTGSSTVNVTSGNRNFVPTGGAKNSETRTRPTSVS